MMNYIRIQLRMIIDLILGMYSFPWNKSITTFYSLIGGFKKVISAQKRRIFLTTSRFTTFMFNFNNISFFKAIGFDLRFIWASTLAHSYNNFYWPANVSKTKDISVPKLFTPSLTLFNFVFVNWNQKILFTKISQNQNFWAVLPQNKIFLPAISDVNMRQKQEIWAF